MQPGWCQPVRQEFMENECEALPGVAYPGVRDNRSTINTKTGYDDDDDYATSLLVVFADRNVITVYVSLQQYTLCLKKVYPLLFDNNIGKCGPIFKIILF